MLSVGALIWVSIRPLIRLALCTACGFVLTKADLFPAIAARGLGQILLNITYPALLFSKIVPAFTKDNVGVLGPLVLVAVLYEAIGVAIAWIVKQFFWVPHRFRHGIIAAGAWSNVGDIPTAIIMSITGSAPFNASQDQSLSVAYISVFILVFFVTLFPMGGHHLIARDFAGPEVDDSEVRMSVAAKTKDSVQRFSKRAKYVGHALILTNSHSYDENAEKDRRNVNDDLETGPQTADIKHAIEMDDASSPMRSQRLASHMSDNEPLDPVPPNSQIRSPMLSDGLATRTPSVDAHAHNSEKLREPRQNADSDHDVEGSTPHRRHDSTPSHQKRLLTQSLAVLRSLCTVQTISIVISFPIALVTPLKALFTPVPHSPIPNAPDGQPPLAILLDTASFIGAASVPLGLISLGSALARLQVRRRAWKDLPLGAIAGLTVGKLILMPVLGVLITQGLTHAGLIREDQKVLRFVCIFFACLPTATTQVFLTQVYSGTGAADTLTSFLIPQYIVMVISMTILSAYALSILF